MNTKIFNNLKRFDFIWIFILMSAFCFALFIFRYLMSDTKVFFFLNWNLFLAGIPLVISTFVLKYEIKSKISLSILIVIWILFFPNSPYILTDLFHLKIRSSIPIWYDLIVILSYAWTGLMFGFVSLLHIQKLLSRHFNRFSVDLITSIFLFIAGFGVYLGRFLRWNSWDILHRPFELFGDISSRLINPFEHPQTWGVTILMGVLLNMMFFTLKNFQRLSISIFTINEKHN